MEHNKHLLHVEFPCNQEDLSGQSKHITFEMITKVIIKIASGKAAGPPWIAPEVRKPDSEAGAIEVPDHNEDITSDGSIPNDRQESYIINMYKGKWEALNKNSTIGG